MVGATDGEEGILSRRGFIGWCAVLLTSSALPGATLWLTAAPASAATISPYSLSSWQALIHRSVQAMMPGTARLTLTVVRVTDRTMKTAVKMTGDMFTIDFQASQPWPAGRYTVSASGLGSVPLYIGGSGSGRTATAVVNRRIPA